MLDPFVGVLVGRGFQHCAGLFTILGGCAASDRMVPNGGAGFGLKESSNVHALAGLLNNVGYVSRVPESPLERARWKRAPRPASTSSGECGHQVPTPSQFRQTIPSLVDATWDREHLRGVANGQADNLRRLAVKGSFRIATLAGIGIFVHRMFFILLAEIAISHAAEGQNFAKVCESSDAHG